MRVSVEIVVIGLEYISVEIVAISSVYAFSEEIVAIGSGYAHRS